MSTTIRFERNAIMALAHLVSPDDGGTAYVWCSIPGGRPVFQFDLKSLYGATSVIGAPQCDTFKAFKAFVNERFGGAA